MPVELLKLGKRCDKFKVHNGVLENGVMLPFIIVAKGVKDVAQHFNGLVGCKSQFVDLAIKSSKPTTKVERRNLETNLLKLRLS